ncbi:MAG: PAS domain-containing sensor histidine kinase, partial [Candidatus Spechtbacterales bacterium]
NILYANKAAEKNTGFSAEEMLGKNPADLWGGNMPKGFYADMWHKIKDLKQPFVGEVRNKRKDGTERWMELHISPILDTDGSVKFFVGIEPDITDRKTRERFREEFLSIIGHQLRNPLTAINWTLDWLFKRGELTQAQQKTLGDVYKHNKDLSNLIDDLLVLSRVERDGTQIKVVNLDSEIESIIATTKKRFPALFLSFEKEGDRFPIHANKSLAYQIFSNIIINAAEYSYKKAGRVTIALNKNPGEYIFSCADNGIGIPKEDQPKVFSRFFRASNANDAKEQGTGLGLFIVKMIADSLGWKVSFESEVGKGTTFFVKIPVK